MGSLYRAASGATTISAMRRGGLVLLAALATSGLAITAAGAVEEPVVIPAPEADLAESGTATAVFAGGCFWGVQGVFQRVDGVTSAVSGYSGGSAMTANYGDVGSGQTGHAEVVEVTYDPSVVSYGELLHVFFSVAHNPTQLDFQGPDRGTQYRSALFVDGAEEQAVAEAYIAQLDATGAYPGPIVTTIEPLAAFYPAEDYHQDYLTLHPESGYIQVHDLPKIDALAELFPDLYAETPVLVGAGQGDLES